MSSNSTIPTELKADREGTSAELKAVKEHKEHKKKQRHHAHGDHTEKEWTIPKAPEAMLEALNGYSSRSRHSPPRSVPNTLGTKRKQDSDEEARKPKRHSSDRQGSSTELSRILTDESRLFTSPKNSPVLSRVPSMQDSSGTANTDKEETVINGFSRLPWVPRDPSTFDVGDMIKCPSPRLDAVLRYVGIELANYRSSDGSRSGWRNYSIAEMQHPHIVLKNNYKTDGTIKTAYCTSFRGAASLAEKSKKGLNEKHFKYFIPMDGQEHEQNRCGQPDFLLELAKGSPKPKKMGGWVCCLMSFDIKPHQSGTILGDASGVRYKATCVKKLEDEIDKYRDIVKDAFKENMRRSRSRSRSGSHRRDSWKPESSRPRGDSWKPESFRPKGDYWRPDTDTSGSQSRTDSLEGGSAEDRKRDNTRADKHTGVFKKPSTPASHVRSNGGSYKDPTEH